MTSARTSRVGYSVALILAFVALAVTGIVGIVGIPWFLAALADGRWQGGVALGIWLAIAAAQFWLIRAAERQLKQSRDGLAISLLVIAMLPAVLLIWIIPL